MKDLHCSIFFSYAEMVIQVTRPADFDSPYSLEIPRIENLFQLDWLLMGSLWRIIPGH